MRGADGVFHVAGWYKLGVRDPREGVRINVDGTRNVLETMRDLGIAKGSDPRRAAIRELGWRARSLEDGLRETLRHEIAALGLPLTVR